MHTAIETPSTVRAQFPQFRPRRLRRTDTLRRMVRETRLSVDSLIYPVFVVPGADVKEEISAMPGVFHQSVDRVVEDARAVADLGIPAMLLFGLPGHKDWEGSESWAPDGIVQQALRAIRRGGRSGPEIRRRRGPPEGPAERSRGDSRGWPGPGRGRGPGDGQASPALSRCRARGQNDLPRRAAGRIQRERRVRHAES